jgi:hypothetical protein
MRAWVKRIALVLAGFLGVCAVAGSITYGIWWGVQGSTARECFTVVRVDDGQGYGHYPAVYASNGEEYNPEEHSGLFLPGQHWCGLVHRENGAMHPHIVVP